MKRSENFIPFPMGPLRTSGPLCYPKSLGRREPERGNIQRGKSVKSKIQSLLVIRILSILILLGSQRSESSQNTNSLVK